MASTPSASALSAVLRCRGNIWTRNPPAKRPSTPGRSRGALRDSPAERTRESPWEAFLTGELGVVVGRRLAVAYKPQRGDESRGNNKVYHPNVAQSSCAAPGGRSAQVRHQTRGLKLNLNNKCFQIIQMIKCDVSTSHVSSLKFVQEARGVFKVSMTSPCLSGDLGQTASLVSAGWSTVRSTCLSLSALVFLRLGVLRGVSSSSGDAPLQHLQDERLTNEDALQVNGQTYCPSDLTSIKDASGSRQTVTEDRPD